MVVLQPDMIQGEGDGVQRLFALLWLQLTFPDGDAMPSHLSQLALFLLIAFLVPSNLRHPELSIRLRYLAARTILNRKW